MEQPWTPRVQGLETATGQVVVAGDWHGSRSWADAVLTATAAAGIDLLIHVGDLNMGPLAFTYEGDRGFIDRTHGVRVVCSPGNHDNHDVVRAAADAYPWGSDSALMAWHDSEVMLAPKGSRWTIDGRAFGGLGGAISVNRDALVSGRDYWPDEAITLGDVYRLGRAPLDVLITHDVPTGTPLRSAMVLAPDMQALCDGQRDLLLEAATATGARVLLAGHHHHRATHQVQGTRVEVLDRERTPGNAVVLDTRTLAVTPLDVPDPDVGLLRALRGR